MLLSTFFAAFLFLLQIADAGSRANGSRRRVRRQCKVQTTSPANTTDYTGSDTVGSDPIGSDTAGASNTAANSTAGTVGSPLIASFTRYGLGDEGGSPNCATGPKADGSCGGPVGRGAIGGFTAAVSNNLYDGPASGAQGKACDTCWKLEANGRSIIVIVDNLCPTSSPDCGMATLQDQNPDGGNVNFDLCNDSGAREALLGDAVTGKGTATKLDSCAGRGSSGVSPIIQNFP